MERHFLREMKFVNGVLSITKGGRRYRVSDCEPMVKVYDCVTQVPMLNRGITVKHRELRIVLCEDNKPQKWVTEDTFNGVTSFELSMEYLREDGEYVAVVLNNLSPIVIDLNEEWEFEVLDRDVVKKLASF